MQSKTLVYRPHCIVHTNLTLFANWLAEWLDTVPTLPRKPSKYDLMDYTTATFELENGIRVTSEYYFAPASVHFTYDEIPVTGAHGPATERQVDWVAVGPPTRARIVQNVVSATRGTDFCSRSEGEAIVFSVQALVIDRSAPEKDTVEFKLEYILDDTSASAYDLLSGVSGATLSSSADERPWLNAMRAAHVPLYEPLESLVDDIRRRWPIDDLTSSAAPVASRIALIPFEEPQAHSANANDESTGNSQERKRGKLSALVVPPTTMPDGFTDSEGNPILPDEYEDLLVVREAWLKREKTELLYRRMAWSDRYGKRLRKVADELNWIRLRRGRSK